MQHEALYNTHFIESFDTSKMKPSWNENSDSYKLTITRNKREITQLEPNIMWYTIGILSYIILYILNDKCEDKTEWFKLQRADRKWK